MSFGSVNITNRLYLLDTTLMIYEEIFARKEEDLGNYISLTEIICDLFQI